MFEKKIIGIVLVRNEDLYIEQVLFNICEFCDEIIVADNISKDKTAEIAGSFHHKDCIVHYHLIKNPSESHELISCYAGKPVWIFAVDGDEIYDPEGLRKLRTKLLGGQFDRSWMIFGNVLNCVGLDLDENLARGYLSPPCRSMTKLYNFNAISAWNGPCPERLHGGTIQFRDDFNKSMRLELHKQNTWENSEFRCLHLCFIKRSSLEKASNREHLRVRKNISDKRSEGVLQKLVNRCISLIGVDHQSDWKKEKYMRGALVEKKVEPFLS